MHYVFDLHVVHIYTVYMTHGSVKRSNMPLREYMCLECGHVQENFERVPEDALTQCVQCESPKIERTITAMGGYHGNFGGSSTKPKNAGAFSGRKKSK